jgi:hypothetical protein
VSERTRLGIVILAAAVPLGLLGDLLLRETPLGLNAVLWTLAFVAALVLVLRIARVAVPRGRRWALGPLVAFAAFLLWRDSAWLAGLNLVAMLAALSLAVVPATRRPWRASLSEYAAGGIASLAGAGAGAVLLYEEIDWRELPRGALSRNAAALGRGTALALPLLALFGALFVAADAVFEQLVADVLPADPADPLTHVLVAGAWAWVATGLLRQLVRPVGEPFGGVESKWRLGTVEVAVLLGTLNALFLAFVLVQLRYLFGGDAHVARETGLTYAEYARHGFFELVAVAALVLPLLLLADWALARDRRTERVFRGLALVLVALLFVVMASALQRMRLYQREYGLTELRVYATGLMLWLGVVFGWALFTVLRGRRERFAVGALVVALVAIAGANVLNPDALIARTNIDRGAAGRPADYTYLAQLSDDAVPTLLERLPSVRPDARRFLAADLLRRSGDGDWRTWNLSRARAAELVDEHSSMLLTHRRGRG